MHLNPFQALPSPEAGAPDESPLPPVERRLTHAELIHRQAARVESPIEDLRTFFGGDAERLVNIRLQVTLDDFLMAQRALAELLAGWRVVAERRYLRYDPTVPGIPERAAIEVAPERFDFVMREGRQFWIGPGGERAVIELDLDEDKKEPDSAVVFLVPESRHAWLRDLLPRVKKLMDEKHFLRGQAINGAGEYLKLGDAPRWEDVQLPATVRQTIERNCIELLGRSELFRANGIPLRRGIILHGKPGTGKTMIGRALAAKCKATFILATPGMLEEPKDVRRVFAWGRRFAPSILFFEDFDLAASGRSSARSMGGRLGEFLSCLDGVDVHEGIVVIATTNDLEAIEPALRDRPSRFDVVLEIPPLARDLRLNYLAAWRERHPGSHSLERWADRTEGFTGAQLQELCRLAALEAVMERIADGPAPPETVPLADRHFESALERISAKRKRAIGFGAGNAAAGPDPSDDDGEDDEGDDGDCQQEGESAAGSTVWSGLKDGTAQA